MSHEIRHISGVTVAVPPTDLHAEVAAAVSELLRHENDAHDGVQIITGTEWTIHVHLHPFDCGDNHYHLRVQIDGPEIGYVDELDLNRHEVTS